MSSQHMIIDYSGAVYIMFRKQNW